MFMDAPCRPGDVTAAEDHPTDRKCHRSNESASATAENVPM